MEDSDPLDSFSLQRKSKGNQSITLFLISFVLGVMAIFLIFMLSNEGVPNKFLRILAPILSIPSFGLSIGGLTVGVSELKYSKSWVKTGIIGNASMILLTVIYVVNAIYYEM